MRLKPCPFCGEEKVNLDPDPELLHFSVWCPICMSAGPWGHNEKDAVIGWNTRVKARTSAHENVIRKAWRQRKECINHRDSILIIVENVDDFSEYRRNEIRNKLNETYNSN